MFCAMVTTILNFQKQSAPKFKAVNPLISTLLHIKVDKDWPAVKVILLLESVIQGQTNVYVYDLFLCLNSEATVTVTEEYTQTLL